MSKRRSTSPPGGCPRRNGRSPAPSTSEHDYAEALLLQGLVCKAQGRLDDAQDSLLLAEHFKPGLAEALFQLGLIAVAQGHPGEAERFFHKAAEADPRHATAHNALGAVLFGRGALEEAAERFRQAVALKPDYALAHSNLGCVLLDAPRPVGGRRGAHRDRVAARAGASRTSWSTGQWCCSNAAVCRSRSRCGRGSWSAARTSEKARLNRALVLLEAGRVLAGLVRLRGAQADGERVPPARLPVSRMEGRSARRPHDTGSLPNREWATRSCLLPACRISCRRAGHCVVECAPKLEAIFRRSFPAATVVSAEEVAAGSGGSRERPPSTTMSRSAACRCIFAVRSEDFPAHDGYLRADAGRTAAWRRRLARAARTPQG